ncbi:MAG: hypothetical protein ACTHK3_12425 [Solirubrobacterales bacterium]
MSNLEAMAKKIRILVSRPLFAAALMAALVCLVVGCGGGGDSGANSASAATGQAGCPVGKSVLKLVPKAPQWWKEGPGPTLALACVKDRFHGSAVIVGFASPFEGSCVTVYNLRAGLSHGEICTSEEGEWTDFFCKGGPGCVQGFVHEPGFTQLAGPVESKVKKIKVVVGGKPLKQGVALAQIENPAVRQIHAGEPFGFFVAFVPGCVVPHEVKVQLLDATGSQIGTAREFSGPAGGCSHRKGSRAPSA